MFGLSSRHAHKIFGPGQKLPVLALDLPKVHAPERSVPWLLRMASTTLWVTGGCPVNPGYGVLPWAPTSTFILEGR